MFAGVLAHDSYFYPRSPCGERLSPLRSSSLQSRFLSTLSLRRATNNGAGFIAVGWNFYPRSPCGERQQTAYFF